LEIKNEAALKQNSKVCDYKIILSGESIVEPEN
jgi:hypothetical protein